MKKIVISLLFGQLLLQYTYISCVAQNQMELIDTLHQYSNYSDIWGFKDDDGSEYAIMGTNGGFTFIRISDPINQSFIPQQVGFISVTNDHSNKDIKTYFDDSGNKYAYLVTDGLNEGLKIVDLSGLPAAVNLVDSLVFSGFERIHNVYIDVPSKRLFLCNIRPWDSTSLDSTQAGLVMLDITNPLNPVQFPNGVYNDFRVHDIYVKNNLLFAGSVEHPDANPLGRVEIFDISGNTFNKLTTHTYFAGQAHSVWLTEDGNFMVTMAEQLDKNAKFWNIGDILNIPSTPEDEFRKGNAIVHNAFIKGNFCYISHYSAGLVVLDISDINNVIEVGYYDTYLSNNNDIHTGAWGVFPYLPSCNIIISDMQTGLYVVTFPQDLLLQDTTISSGIEKGYAAKNTITAAGSGTTFTVESGAHSVLAAKDEVWLKDGFWAKEGSYFWARNEDPCGQGTFQSQRIQKPDANDAITEQSITKKALNQTINEFLAPNAPNPFTKSTSIAYSLKEPGPVELSVFNSSSKKIAELVKSNYLPANTYIVTFDAADISPGIYYYTLITSNHVETKKMIVLK